LYKRFDSTDYALTRSSFIEKLLNTKNKAVLYMTSSLAKTTSYVYFSTKLSKKSIKNLRKQYLSQSFHKIISVKHNKKIRIRGTLDKNLDMISAFVDEIVFIIKIEKI
jgi:hypothetical protein